MGENLLLKQVCSTKPVATVLMIGLLLLFTQGVYAQHIDEGFAKGVDLEMLMSAPHPDGYAYIEKYKDLAIQEMRFTGIPASIKLAQGMFESNFGKSRLAKDGNNHFGIKCGSKWDGSKIKHDDDEPDECFRVYGKAYDSYVDHSEFLKNKSRYAFLFGFDGLDYEAWAHGLKKAGYATNPKYPEKLIQVIKSYGLAEIDKESLKEIVAVNPDVLCKEVKPASVIEVKPMEFNEQEAVRHSNDLGNAMDLIEQNNSQYSTISANSPTVQATNDLTSLDEVLGLAIAERPQNINRKCLLGKPAIAVDATRIEATIDVPKTKAKSNNKPPKKTPPPSYVGRGKELNPNFNPNKINTKPATASIAPSKSYASSATSHTKVYDVNKSATKVTATPTNSGTHIVSTPSKTVTSATVPASSTHHIVSAPSKMVTNTNRPSDTGIVPTPNDLMNKKNKVPAKENKVTKTTTPVAPVKAEKAAPKSLKKTDFFTCNGLEKTISYNVDVTFKQVAQVYKIDIIELLQYNDATNANKLIPAYTHIYLQEKKSKSIAKEYKVKKGDTMWSIAQNFGVKLDGLYKRNKMKPSEEPRAKEIILLRGKAPYPPKIAK